MIECPKCGAKRVRAGAQFCDHCGTRIPDGLSKLVSETEELRAHLKHSDQLQARVDALESTLQTRNQELGPLRMKSQELEAENKELKDLKAKTNRELAEYEDLRTKTIESLKTKITSLETENRQLNDLRAEIETDRRESESLQARMKEIESQRGKILALETENKELKAKTGTEGAEYESLHAKVKELESLQTKVVALEVENRELQTIQVEAQKREEQTKPAAVVPQATQGLLPREAMSHRRRYLGLFLIAFGVLTMLASLIVGIVNLSGLGLASFLIGLLVVYLPSPSTVAPELMEASMLSSIGNLERVLRELGPESKGVYLAVHDRLDVPTIFLPLVSNSTAHSLQLTSLDADRFLLVDSGDPQRTGLVLEAPGASLLALMEKESGVDFFDIERNDLLDSLRSGFVESLEIAADLKGTVEGNPVKLKIKDGPLSGFVRSITRSAPTVSSRLGCPICSAAICAIVKSTKRDIVLEEVNHESGSHSLSLRFEGAMTDETR